MSIESELRFTLSSQFPNAVMVDRFRIDPNALRDLLYTTFRLCGYETPKIDESTHTATAVRSLPIPAPLSGTRRTMATLIWASGSNSQTSESQLSDEMLVAWIAFDQSPGSRGRPEVRATEEIGARLRHATTAHLLGIGAPRYQLDPVIEPGQIFEAPYRGNLRDYSMLATVNETSHLRHGVLPLGRYCFDPSRLIRDVDASTRAPDRHDSHDDQEEEAVDVNVGLDRSTKGNLAKESHIGPELFLAPESTGTRERRGVLVCAPQNSGKTTLLTRWARAANEAGYNLFLIDVKGNLLQRLKSLRGDVYHFSTNPDTTPEQPFDRINFLNGLDPLTAKGSERIRDLAVSLLPREAARSHGQEDVFQYRNWVIWLTAMIHFVKLREIYLPGHFVTPEGIGRAPDLNDLYELSVNEGLLYEYIVCLREAEYFRLEDGEPLAHCDVDHWVRELLHLLDARKSPNRFKMTPKSLAALESQLSSDQLSRARTILGTVYPTEDIFREVLEQQLGLNSNEPIIEACIDAARLVGEGDREAEHGYRDYTQGIVTALEPFSKHGTLYERITSHGTGRLFDLKQLNDEGRQTTIVLTAREQDQEKASTVLSVVVKRIMHLMMDRVDRENKTSKILLLLDETRRIRSFEPQRYITFAREAEAGCVIVYQSLDQIGDDRAIFEILENVGTQIYLGSLVGSSAKYFLSMLPKRYRTAIHEQFTYTMDGRGRTQVIGNELVDYLTTNELYRLPGGRHPALVYLNDAMHHSLFTVDLYDPDAAKEWSSTKSVQKLEDSNDE